MEYDQTQSVDENSDASSVEDWMDAWDTGHVTANKLHGIAKYQCTDATLEQAVNGNNARNVSLDVTGTGSVTLLTCMQLNDNKAGMQGLDKAHINQIIYAASKGSKFFENERKKEEQLRVRIKEQENRRIKISEAELQRGKEEADKLLTALEASRNLSQTVVHVDMDAFYAAVEMKDNPSLLGKPMAVGGMGMLSTSNYEARKYGVRAAMPGFIGCKLCPQLIIVPPNFARYTEVSHQVRDVLSKYDPNYCPVSLDEAYLNLTAHLEERCTFPRQQRTFLCRCSPLSNFHLCRCDLNMTLRDSLVLSKDSEVRPCTKSHEQSTLQGINTLMDGKCIPHINNKNLDTVEVHSQNFEDRDCLKTQALGQQTEDFREHQLGACPVCHKPVPEFKVVTFGVDAESAVQEMRCRIEQATGLTASAGIAPNMMLAKVCSDQNKPNGQYLLPANRDTVMDFIRNLPIRKISGIGRVTEQLLGALGITTCQDLYNQRSLLYHLYSPVSFNYFMRVACGIGSINVTRDEDRKSISTEQTFRELSQPEDMYSKCWELCQSLAEDLAAEQLMGKTISLKLKTTDFQVRTRDRTINSYIDDAENIFAIAKCILQNEIQANFPKPLCLRLMGVRMSKLHSANESLREKQETIINFISKTGALSQDKQCSSGSLAQACSNPYNTDSGRQLTLAHREDEAQNMKLVPEMSFLSYKGSKNNINSSAFDQLSVVREDTSLSSEQLLDITDTSKIHECKINKTESHTAKKNLAFSSTPDSCKPQIPVDSCTHQKVLGVFNSQKAVTSSKDFCNSQTPETNISTVITPTKHFISNTYNNCNIDGNYITSDLKLSVINTQQSEHIMNHTANHHQEDGESVRSAREPSFTCPVCCSPISCINLTDLNKHIDKCLQASDSSPQSQNNPVSGVTGMSQKSTTGSKKLQSVSQSKKRNKLAACNFQSRTHDDATNWRGCDSGRVKHVIVSKNASHESLGAGCTEKLKNETVEYLTCPLCGAERADWTLETFNHHVDACLNRDTISKILQEQEQIEISQEKRPGTTPDGKMHSGNKKAKQSTPLMPAQSILKRPGTTTDGKVHSGNKRAKQSTPLKPAQSILSFFKS